MELRRPAGYEMLLHSQATCDAYNVRKIIKAWRKFTNSVIAARCHYYSLLLGRAFTKVGKRMIFFILTCTLCDYDRAAALCRRCLIV